MLKADLHIHTHFSRDCATPPERVVRRCLDVGLNCIAVTDHNTIRGALAVQKIAPFRVIIGEEVKTSRGEIIGLFLHKEIPRGLSPMETVQRIREQGGLVAVPHPFDRFRRSVLEHQALLEILPNVDLVEVFNARNMLLRDSQKALDFAKKHNLLVSVGSDAHVPSELGNAFLELPEFQGGPQEFKQALLHARVFGKRTTPFIHVITTFTKLRRRLRLLPMPA